MIRVENYKSNVEIKDINTIWFLGDSITEGYGEKYQDTYYSVLSKIFKKNIQYNIVPISAGAYTTYDLADVLIKFKNLQSLMIL